MILFLAKGVFRDRSRSLFPMLVVIVGVMLTVFLYSFLRGVINDVAGPTARFSTGDVRITTRAYAKELDQMPNDLAYVGVGDLIRQVRHDYPAMIWTERILFGGLLDIPDAAGETKTQGPVAGMAVDLRSAGSREAEIINLKPALVRGRLPSGPGEILVSDEFARRLGVAPGGRATLISSTMNGGMAVSNFTVAGTIRFGVEAMDRGAMIADLADIQDVLEMDDAAAEVLGFFPDFNYNDRNARSLAQNFNARFSRTDDQFSPVMGTLREQSGMADMLDLATSAVGVIIVAFVLIMSIVLWNAGLLSSLRRYGEIGMRLALGEAKGHIYRTLLAESLIIGVFGSAVGTAFGLAVSFILQQHGLNIGSMVKNASMMMTNVIRAQITPVSFVIGFAPGLIATFLGTAVSGIGVYRRQTARLAKELET